MSVPLRKAEAEQAYRRAQDEAADRGDSQLSTPCSWRSAGIGLWWRGCGDRVTAESCGHRFRIRADERQKRADYDELVIVATMPGPGLCRVGLGGPLIFLRFQRVVFGIVSVVDCRRCW